jgi:glycosyltransferase involved in cell wall biosynthesis
MTRKKVLVVAMLDSVHTARWLSQFTDEQIDFTIFASKKYKQLHPNLLGLITSKNSASYQLANFIHLPSVGGYLDFICFVITQQYLRLPLRALNLKRLIRKSNFTYIHALEIQGAGYLVDSALGRDQSKGNLILTNWGSDIYYYKNFPEHKMRIQSALKRATHYSAECRRDYKLAEEFGFIGKELPCIPNAGGFDLSLVVTQSLSSSRKNIVAKAYGGDFGRGDIITSSLEKVLKTNRDVTTFLYSVTDDIEEMVKDLQAKYPGRVDYSHRRNPLSRAQMNDLFLRSRIYIGASRSDGISTSFLEALISGCYPVQTNTSCADEWVKLGASASLVGMQEDQLLSALLLALGDNELVDKAQISNKSIAEQFLSNEVVKPLALTFYDS